MECAHSLTLAQMVTDTDEMVAVAAPDRPRRSIDTSLIDDMMAGNLLAVIDSAPFLCRSRMSIGTQ